MDRLVLRQVPRAMAPLRVWRAGSLLQPRFASTEASSARRYIVFDSDVSPDLAPVLTEIQNKIILPSYINDTQRERIFDEKHRQSLKTNPVIIEIDDITHRFDHITQKELPRTKAMLIDAVGKMETSSDFANLGRLLDGLRHAKRKVPVKSWTRITRILGRKRQIWIAIEAARQVKRTNFKVSSPVVAHDMLFWTQVKAFEAGWERAETEQALRWARVVIEMAASPAHKMDSKRNVQFTPLERDPLVLTTPLHLASAIAVGHEGGKDVDGEVARVARQLVDVWPQGKSLAEVYPEEQLNAPEFHGGVPYVRSNPGILAKLSMALHSLRLAEQVLEPALADHIGSIANAVQADLANRRSAMGELKEGSVVNDVFTGLFDDSGKIKFEVKPQEAQPEPAEEAGAPEAAEEAAPATEEK